LLYALPLAIAEQARLLATVRAAAVDSGAPSLNYNYAMLFREFLTQSIGAPWNVAKLHSLSTFAAIGICLFFPLSVVFSSDLDNRKKWPMLVVLSSFYVLLWVVPLLTAGDAHDRYYLSGSAIAMISLGYGVSISGKKNPRGVASRSFSLFAPARSYISVALETSACRGLRSKSG
jgi:hypothetical protein